MPKRERSRRVENARCVLDAGGRTILLQRWGEGKRHSSILGEGKPVEKKAVQSSRVYLPNNPFTDLTGFCVMGFFMRPPAACFSILPTSA